MVYQRLLKRCLSVSSPSKIIQAPEKLVYPSLAAHQFIIEGVEKNINNVLAVS